MKESNNEPCEHIPDNLIQASLENIGLITVLWNNVDFLWYIIYTSLIPGASREITDKIYQCFTSGHSRRKFIIHISEESFKETNDLYIWIKALDEESGRLSTLRNSAIHANYWISYFEGKSGLRISPSNDMNKKSNLLADNKNDVSKRLKNISDEIEEHIKELNDFRIYLIQNFIPEPGRTKPHSPDFLAKIPEEIKKGLPRELLEEVPLRKFPTNSRKRKTHQK